MEMAFLSPHRKHHTVDAQLDEREFQVDSMKTSRLAELLDRRVTSVVICIAYSAASQGGCFSCDNQWTCSDLVSSAWTEYQETVCWLCKGWIRAGVDGRNLMSWHYLFAANSHLFSDHRTEPRAGYDNGSKNFECYVTLCVTIYDITFVYDRSSWIELDRVKNVERHSLPR